MKHRRWRKPRVGDVVVCVDELDGMTAAIFVVDGVSVGDGALRPVVKRGQRR